MSDNDRRIGFSPEILTQWLQSGVELWFPPSSAQTPDALRAAVLAAKKLAEKGFKTLVISGPDAYLRDYFLKIVRAARLVGFEKVLLIAPSESLTRFDALKTAAEACDALILREEYDAPDFAKNAAKLANECKAPVIPHIVAFSSQAQPLARRANAALDAKLPLVLLGFPLPRYFNASDAAVPDVNELRAGFVAVKYEWFRRKAKIAFMDFPMCAFSFGEDLGFPVMPQIPIFSSGEPLRHNDETPRRSRRFRPQGIVECAKDCRYGELCPGLPKNYVEKEGRKPPYPLWTDYLQSEGAAGESAIIRPIFICNQRCPFCFIKRPGPSPTFEEMRERLSTLRLEELVISGGEPTLFKELRELAQTAREGGAKKIALQTNAVTCADWKFAKRVLDAGIDQAFVSLHAGDEELSLKMGGRKGDFEKTLAGIDNLAKGAAEVFLNCVIQELNYRGLPEFVRWGKKRFNIAKNSNVQFCFSFIAVYDDAPNPEQMRFVPKLTEVKPYLLKAITPLADEGIQIYGLNTQCGIPRCILDGDERFYIDLAEAKDFKDFVKKPSCAKCVYDNYCFGIRKQYFRHYGGDEFKPVAKRVPVKKGFFRR